MAEKKAPAGDVQGDAAETADRPEVAVPVPAILRGVIVRDRSTGADYAGTITRVRETGPEGRALVDVTAFPPGEQPLPLLAIELHSDRASVEDEDGDDAPAHAAYWPARV